MFYSEIELRWPCRRRSLRPLDFHTDDFSFENNFLREHGDDAPENPAAAPDRRHRSSPAAPARPSFAARRERSRPPIGMSAPARPAGGTFARSSQSARPRRADAHRRAATLQRRPNRPLADPAARRRRAARRPARARAPNHARARAGARPASSRQRRARRGRGRRAAPPRPPALRRSWRPRHRSASRRRHAPTKGGAARNA